jgi:transposase InsO family protein
VVVELPSSQAQGCGTVGGRRFAKGRSGAGTGSTRTCRAQVGRGDVELELGRCAGRSVARGSWSRSGSQYLSIRYTDRLREAGLEASVGSAGDSYDNALAETINGLYRG